jgi:hypothetical protein
LEEEKLPFPTLFNPFRPTICNQSKPQIANTTQNELTQNPIAVLLLLHSFPKIQLESASILPKAPAVPLFANILVHGKYAIKR